MNNLFPVSLQYITSNKIKAVLVVNCCEEILMHVDILREVKSDVVVLCSRQSVSALCNGNV